MPIASIDYHSICNDLEIWKHENMHEMLQDNNMEETVLEDILLYF